MFKTILKFLSGGPAEQIGEYFNQRQKLKQELKITKIQGEIAIATATVKAKIAQQEHIQTWEQTYVNAQAHSLKDEVVLGVVLFPYVGAFIPGIQDYIVIGFEYLDKMPYWAVGLTVTILLAIYGIRHKNASRLSAPGLRDSDVEAKG